MGGVSSPATEDACEPLVEAFFEPAFEDSLEAAVFLVSPFSAFLAIRAAFEAVIAGILRVFGESRVRW